MLLSYTRWGAAAAGVLAMALAWAAPVWAGSPPTNYALVDSAAGAACASIAAELSGRGDTPTLGLRAVGNASGNFLVENALLRALSAAGLTVSTRPDTTAPVLEFQVVDLGLTYLGTHRHRLVGRQHVQREARARVFVRLVDPGHGNVLWAKRAEAKEVDEVRATQLVELEEKSPADFLKATLPARRWNKVVEPVVVTGILVGLVVLFFSNQDTK
jgi:hypothetical protein